MSDEYFQSLLKQWDNYPASMKIEAFLDETINMRIPGFLIKRKGEIVAKCNNMHTRGGFTTRVCNVFMGMDSASMYLDTMFGRLALLKRLLGKSQDDGDTEIVELVEET